MFLNVILIQNPIAQVLKKMVTVLLQVIIAILIKNQIAELHNTIVRQAEQVRVLIIVKNLIPAIVKIILLQNQAVMVLTAEVIRPVPQRVVIPVVGQILPEEAMEAIVQVQNHHPVQVTEHPVQGDQAVVNY